MKDNSKLKGIFAIVGIVLAVAAIVTSILVFKDQLTQFFEESREKIKARKESEFEEEYSDFADI